MRYFCIILIVIFFGCIEPKNESCEIAYLKKFATQYTHDEWNTLTHKLPEKFCSKVINAYQCDSSETMVYLNLLMLKMYLSHLESSEIGHMITPFYDLETRDIIRMDKPNQRNCMYYLLQENSKKTVDGIYSGIGYYNVKNDTTLLENEAIRIAFFDVKTHKHLIDSLETYHPQQLK